GSYDNPRQITTMVVTILETGALQGACDIVAGPAACGDVPFFSRVSAVATGTQVSVWDLMGTTVAQVLFSTTGCGPTAPGVGSFGTTCVPVGTKPPPLSNSGTSGAVGASGSGSTAGGTPGGGTPPAGGGAPPPGGASGGAGGGENGGGGGATSAICPAQPSD